MCAQAGFKFVPMVMEAHGAWSPAARRVLDWIAGELSATSGESRGVVCLRMAQRKSCILHRENAHAPSCDGQLPQQLLHRQAGGRAPAMRGNKLGCRCLLGVSLVFQAPWQNEKEKTTSFSSALAKMGAVPLGVSDWGLGARAWNSPPPAWLGEGVWGVGVPRAGSGRRRGGRGVPGSGKS